MVDERASIWSAQQVVSAIPTAELMDITPRYVQAVLRNEFKMRYKRIKPIPFQGNSDKNLILRQQYAMSLLEELHKGIVCINIDETFINSGLGRYRRWRERNATNSVRLKSVSPRIGMITAIDTEGRIYLSLTQTNTDSNVFCMFLTKLTCLLTRERPGFRSNTVFVVDGASWHQSEATLRHYKRLQLKVIISGPYSYSAAVCELFFSQFKSKELNPEHRQVGKRNFGDLVKLVNTRVAETLQH